MPKTRVRYLEERQAKRNLPYGGIRPSVPSSFIEEEAKIIKQLKEQIAAIYKENEENILRRCALYFTQYKTCVRFVCSKCWEKRH